MITIRETSSRPQKLSRRPPTASTKGAPLVDNCTIEAGEQWTNDLRISLDAAGATVRDTRIVNNADHRAVVIRDRGSGVETRPTRLVNVDLEHGGRSGGYAVENFRPGVEIVGGHWQAGSARSKRHLLVSNPRMRMRGTTVETDQVGLLLRGAESTFADVEFRGGEIHVASDAADGFRFDGRCVDVDLSVPDSVEDAIRGVGGGSGNGW